MTARKAKPEPVTAPVIPADVAFGNAIMSIRDEADASGSRLQNALVNCEATYNRELTRVNAAYMAERTSLTEQLAAQNLVLDSCDAALERLKSNPSNVVPINRAAE